MTHVKHRPKCPECERVMQGVYIHIGSSSNKTSRWANVEGVWFCRRCVAIYDGVVKICDSDYKEGENAVQDAVG